MAKKWIKHNESVLYENDWIELKQSDVTNPRGNLSKYTFVNFKNIAGACIPIDNAGNLYLVGQHRFPLDNYSWEIPTGGANPSKDILEECKRELKEETGIEADQWKELMTIQTSNSITNEIAKIYICIGLKFGTQELDDTEDIQVRRVSFKEALRMVMEGEIEDSITVAGILKLAVLTKTYV
jgi:8-oxo-dGTP pyrophosphatase MutT (NUDIX family)